MLRQEAKLPLGPLAAMCLRTGTKINSEAYAKMVTEPLQDMYLMQDQLVESIADDLKKIGVWDRRCLGSCLLEFFSASVLGFSGSGVLGWSSGFAGPSGVLDRGDPGTDVVVRGGHAEEPQQAHRRAVLLGAKVESLHGAACLRCSGVWPCL